jgi:ribosomal protein S18 acetylase RimI-like enzyme
MFELRRDGIPNHWSYRFVPDPEFGGVSGFKDGRGSATVHLHATRGLVVRVSGAAGGGPNDVPAFLADVVRRARAERMAAVYVSADLISHPTLVRACENGGFARLAELVMSRTIHVPGESPSDAPAALPEGIVVRPMSADEYPFVRGHLLPLVSGGSYMAESEAIDEWLRARSVRPFVVVENGRIIAYAENNLHHGVDGDGRSTTYVRVERVVVAAEARGRGLSKMLVAELIRDAAADGSRVELQVRPGYIAAIRAYTGLGFNPNGGQLYVKMLD